VTFASFQCSMKNSSMMIRGMFQARSTNHFSEINFSKMENAVVAFY
jgi:hypothetical protein